MRATAESVLDILSNEPVHGDLLSDRLAAGPLPERLALQIAVGIGDALARLHREGRVHGFLSPHVISITGGIARIFQPNAVSREYAALYRAPDATPDWRSDIYSYGAILKELAPHNAAVARVSESCLVKDPAHRRQRMRNAVIELKLARGSLPRIAASHETPERRRPLRNVLAIAIAILLLAVTIAGLAAVLYLRKPARAVMNFAVAPPEHTTFPGNPAVSPDGLSLAFSAIGADGQRMLWLRSFDELPTRVIPGTEGGIAPFWSPDGRYLGFFANKSLMKIPVGAGSDAKPELLYAADFQPGGGTWNADGTILFAPSLADGIYRISSHGGNFSPVLKLQPAKGQRADLWPQFLPDGKHFIYFGLTDAPETTGVYVAATGGSPPQFLFPSTTNAVFSPDGVSGTGYLLYMRDRDLMVQGFDNSRLALEGQPILRATDIGAIESLCLAPVSVSQNGVLVYQPVGSTTRRLAWMDRSGKTISTPGDTGEWGAPAIAPDGVRAAVARTDKDGRTVEIWIFGNGGPPAPLSAGVGPEFGFPIWSPDGSRIAFAAAGGPVRGLFVKKVGSPAKAELIYRSEFPLYPTDWSRDGKWLLFGERNSETSEDIHDVDLIAGQSGVVLGTIHSESYATLSPDRKWLAFQTDASGRYEVVVQAWDNGAPGTKRQWQVSQAGGGLPHWRGDGSELFYITNTGALMSA